MILAPPCRFALAVSFQFVTRDGCQRELYYLGQRNPRSSNLGDLLPLISNLARAPWPVLSGLGLISDAQRRLAH